MRTAGATGSGLARAARIECVAESVAHEVDREDEQDAQNAGGNPLPELAFEHRHVPGVVQNVAPGGRLETVILPSSLGCRGGFQCDGFKALAGSFPVNHSVSSCIFARKDDLTPAPDR